MQARPRPSCANFWVDTCAAAPAMFRSSGPRSKRPARIPAKWVAMLDLGTSFLASVARDPAALAIVDGEQRLTYQAWYGRISALVHGLDELGLAPGDHLVTVLQNRSEAATIHGACQFAGIIVTPLNWRASADDLDYCLADAEAKAVVYEDVSREAVAAAKEARRRPRIAVGAAASGDVPFAALADRTAADA